MLGSVRVNNLERKLERVRGHLLVKMLWDKKLVSWIEGALLVHLVEQKVRK